MLLQGKNAIIYGGGGSLGRGTAAVFAREGAHVALVGRTQATLDEAAAEIGGSVETAAIDALDGPAVEAHAREFAERRGSLDVSFNLVMRGDVQGIPLTEMTLEQLEAPVIAGIRSTFNTATPAARLMAAQESGGVILGLNSGSANAAAPGMGGTGPADAVQESFLRYLAAECGRDGVRVLNLWTAGVEESLTDEKLRAVSDQVPPREQVIAAIAGMTALGRVPRLADVAETAAFLASDRGAGMTGFNVQVNCGLTIGR